MSPQEFGGRVAIITGGSTGIGLATAQMLAARGTLVSIFARSASAALLPVNALMVDGDVSNPEDVERLFAETEARFGDCDILINCAGMIDPKPLVEVAPD